MYDGKFGLIFSGNYNYNSNDLKKIWKSIHFDRMINFKLSQNEHWFFLNLHSNFAYGTFKVDLFQQRFFFLKSLTVQQTRRNVNRLLELLFSVTYVWREANAFNHNNIQYDLCVCLESQSTCELFIWTVTINHVYTLHIVKAFCICPSD